MFDFLFQILNKWFESEPLKATLATDAVIGAMISPETPGSGWGTFNKFLAISSIKIEQYLVNI